MGTMGVEVTPQLLSLAKKIMPQLTVVSVAFTTVSMADETCAHFEQFAPVQFDPLESLIERDLSCTIRMSGGIGLMLTLVWPHDWPPAPVMSPPETGMPPVPNEPPVAREPPVPVDEEPPVPLEDEPPAPVEDEPPAPVEPPEPPSAGVVGLKPHPTHVNATASWVTCQSRLRMGPPTTIGTGLMIRATTTRIALTIRNKGHIRQAASQKWRGLPQRPQGRSPSAMPVRFPAIGISASFWLPSRLARPSAPLAPDV